MGFVGLPFESRLPGINSCLCAFWNTNDITAFIFVIEGHSSGFLLSMNGVDARDLNHCSTSTGLISDTRT